MQKIYSMIKIKKKIKSYNRLKVQVRKKRIKINNNKVLNKIIKKIIKNSDLFLFAKLYL